MPSYNPLGACFDAMKLLGVFDAMVNFSPYVENFYRQLPEHEGEKIATEGRRFFRAVV